ncbi:hypothetical protein ACFLWD_03530, partial [Chloroflexota bacterium]
AAESIECDPEVGEIGDKVYVNGEDFDADERVYIYFARQEVDVRDEIDEDLTVYYRRSGTASVGAVGDSDEGEFSKYFYIPEILTKGDDAPEDVYGGTYFVYVTYYDSDRIEAVAEFVVTGIEIDLDEGLVGTEVEISGIGFDSREDIEITYDDESIDIKDGDDETDSSGEFDCTIEIPPSAIGEHTIIVEDESNNEGNAQFTVEPEIIISPTLGSPAEQVTIGGTGFEASESMTITFDSTAVTTSPSSVSSDTYGSFTGVTFVVPSVLAGTYNITAGDTTGNTVTKTFAIEYYASLSPTTGSVGTALTVSGSGFVAGGTVTVKYDTVQAATVAVDTSGAFSVTFDAPISEGGIHTLTATDGTNTEEFTFTMEAEPPPTSKSLLPATGSIIEEESPVSLDWEDVTDPSGVTYTLQVAADSLFSSIALEKVGLTLSGYTITEAERETLALTEEEETTYYWQVKAIDSASNEGEWSTAGSFILPRSGFTLPDWVIYLLFGVGALLLGILGFWLGRRAAYRY